MSDKLISSRLMLTRAKHHIADLEAQFEGWMRSNPYAKIVEFDIDTGEDVHKVRVVNIFPSSLHTIANDVVQNIRAALDHAAYATSIAAGLKGKYTHFPFGDTAAEVHGRKFGGSKEIPDQIFALMEAFKPYLGGDDLLWTLHKLCNSNKHRMLAPVAVSQKTRVTMERHGYRGIPTWDAANNELEIGRVPHGKEFNYQMTITTFIHFSNVETVKGKPAPPILKALVDKVDVILTAIDTEAKRIGFFD